MMETHFRTFLQSELERRQQANPRYSLRQFAKFLNLEPSFLSKILRGQRSVTLPLLQSLGKRLQLSYSDLENYKLQLLKNMESPQSRKVVPRSKFLNLSIEQISFMAGWHYFAILELLTVPGFESHISNIAKVLKLNESEVGLALERLEKLKLLARDPAQEGAYVPSNHTITKSPFTTKELKLIQHQFFSKAVESIEKDSIDERDHSGMTLAIAEKDIPEAKKMIQAFRRKMMTQLQAQKQFDRIYQLSIAFFPLSARLKTEGNKKMRGST